MIMSISRHLIDPELLPMLDLPDNGLTAFSPNAFGDTPATNNYHVAIPLTGWVVKPAGTYNIAVRCAVVTGTTVSHTASLNYTAVPAP